MANKEWQEKNYFGIRLKSMTIEPLTSRKTFLNIQARTDDEMMLLANGTLTHKLVHEHENVISDTRLYEPGKYCVENLVAAKKMKSLVK